MDFDLLKQVFIWPLIFVLRYPDLWLDIIYISEIIDASHLLILFLSLIVILFARATFGRGYVVQFLKDKVQCPEHIFCQVCDTKSSTYEFCFLFTYIPMIFYEWFDSLTSYPSLEVVMSPWCHTGISKETLMLRFCNCIINHTLPCFSKQTCHFLCLNLQKVTR